MRLRGRIPGPLWERIRELIPLRGLMQMTARGRIRGRRKAGSKTPNSTLANYVPMSFWHTKDRATTKKGSSVLSFWNIPKWKNQQLPNAKQRSPAMMPTRQAIFFHGSFSFNTISPYKNGMTVPPRRMVETTEISEAVSLNANI